MKQPIAFLTVPLFEEDFEDATALSASLEVISDMVRDQETFALLRGLEAKGPAGNRVMTISPNK